jgi:serine/threonine protein kinase
MASNNFLLQAQRDELEVRKKSKGKKNLVSSTTRIEKMKRGGALLGVGQSGCVFDDNEQLDKACSVPGLQPYKPYAAKLMPRNEKVKDEQKISEMLRRAEDEAQVPRNTYFVGVDDVCNVNKAIVSRVANVCETKRGGKSLPPQLTLAFTPLIENAVTYLIMPWQDLGESDILIIWQHLLTGLKIMHNAGVLHMDIKDDNIVFDMNNVLEPKYIDFGQSELVKNWEAEPNEAIKHHTLTRDDENLFAMISASRYMQHDAYRSAFEKMRETFASDLLGSQGQQGGARRSRRRRSYRRKSHHSRKHKASK